MLWSPLDKETKYKAKNTIDVPVYRGADYVIAQAQSAISSSRRHGVGIMIVGAVVAACGASSAGGSDAGSKAARRPGSRAHPPSPSRPSRSRAHE